ncbi:MAG: hypothetical protein LUQ71_02900 [Methanoregula sp.]|jgi:hypothetical protein|nr:hypothetical protein [Methanoregula sp.]
MTRHPEFPEMLDQYMETSGSAERWVTVRELRSYFQLDESAGPALSGFLHKIHHGPFVSCRYKVARIEKFRDTTPPYRIIKKYLVQVRPVQTNSPVYGAKK